MVAATLAQHPREHALAVSDVSHAFSLQTVSLPVLDHISLDIEPGEFVAFLGPSGCGKSTLLRLIAGLEQPLSGLIEHRGGRVLTPDPSRVVVFQDPTLYPWRTVWKNVALGLEAQGRLKKDKHRVDEAIERVGLTAFAQAYPHQLSGGMAQRASLARALVNDPDLLILDEPLGKLDSLTRIEMQSELVRLWQQSGFTVLLVTHDIEEALMLSTRILLLQDRPARIKADIKVEAAYPRHRDDTSLIALRHTIMNELGLEKSW